MIALIILSCLVVTTLFSGFFASKKITAGIGVFGLLAAGVFCVLGWTESITTFYNDMLIYDHYTIAFGALCMLTAMAFVVLIAYNTEILDVPRPEMTALIIATTFGAYIMLSAHNLVMLFLGIEILSISLYVLAGTNRVNIKSNEAAMKYFLMGSFATGFLLFGMALIYGATGTFHYVEIGLAANVLNQSAMLIIGVLLLMFGLAFKIAAVPFHFWSPDVYEGSPTVITGFMATLVKIAGIAAFFRLFIVCFSPLSESWGLILSIIAIATMLTGNILAVAQSKLKRMLAYSGIGHAGYLLIALLSMQKSAESAILFYAAVYTFATIAAFAVLLLVQKVAGHDDIKTFNGLSKRNPLAALVMTIALLSMAGIPPTAGFWAKYYIFYTVFESGLLPLLFVAIVTSCIGIYYYFKVIAAMYFVNVNEEKVTQSKNQSLAIQTLMTVSIILVIVLSIFPNLLMQLI